MRRGNWLVRPVMLFISLVKTPPLGAPLSAGASAAKAGGACRPACPGCTTAGARSASRPQSSAQPVRICSSKVSMAVDPHDDVPPAVKILDAHYRNR